ncbi:glycoside hydrolase family 99-like domain-containing protein [Swingsia samuiensis]|uniref:Glycosyltransferase n=1 Tax=Swingsia samuiensis TaxID=1293412 RepID=A0A4Y6UIZ9_9PROT|nr:glycoside hydrolase family 99-like domain-containing protein [Swingsia samuiensis]QDH16337.1 glycosyltransferase [Swingsia samuiensis]
MPHDILHQKTISSHHTHSDIPKNTLQLIGHSGVFDIVYYNQTYPDLISSGVNALHHYHHHGWKEGYQPNAFFNPVWYQQQNPHVTGDPLLHYISQGEAEGLRPIAWFDPIWYRQTYDIPSNSLALAHYLTHRNSRIFRPIPEFDPEFYLTVHADVAKAGVAPLEHYIVDGYKEKRSPNPYFNPHWYQQQAPHITDDLLLHYLTQGEQEGLWPIAWFDPVWYRQTYDIPEGMSALAHYLLNRHRKGIYPLPAFEPDFYLKTYPDIASAGIDPVEHYMVQGFKEDRLPFEGFDPTSYKKQHLPNSPSANPLLHYLEHKDKPNALTPPPKDISVFDEIRRRTEPSPLFESFKPLPDSAIRKARVLAYYLPQYHPIPENNAWWGEGFTEWTNIARSAPRFVDHYQPRIPRDLGHYTLTSPDILERQAKMARQGGIEGFIFYFYWFNQKRLLDGPLEILLANPHIDLPFCLMWANENWSRRWDGSDHDILIEQHYRSSDDNALVDSFARHMKDKRYITIQNRPLLMVYRAGSIPSPTKNFAKWRKLFQQRHNLNPIFIMGQTFQDEDPSSFGVDGAIEFPPHKTVSNCRLINEEVQLLDAHFSGQIYDYAEIVTHALQAPAPDFPLIRTATPSWDNDARRQGKGLVMHGSTPQLYELWLKGLVEKANTHRFFNEAIVCINAWNEWAEGAYLEPDIHFGSAYLNATAHAITNFDTLSHPTGLLLIGHDAFPAGAQKLLLEIGRCLRYSFGVPIRFILLEDGALLKEYQAIAPVEVLSGIADDTIARLSKLKSEGFQHALLNSAASSEIALALHHLSIPFTFLIHELNNLLRSRKLYDKMHSACQYARSIIVPSESVTHALKIEDYACIDILPQGLYTHVSFSAHARHKIRKKLHIPSKQRVIIGAGYADMRKGFDLFLQAWRQSNGEAFFLWIGDIDTALYDHLYGELRAATQTNTFYITGYVDNISQWFSAGDAFALPSREDPYPSAILEALACGLPCISFDNSGGIPALLHSLNTQDTPRHGIVPFGHTHQFATKCLQLAQQSLDIPTKERNKYAVTFQKIFDFAPYVEKLFFKTMPDIPKISVIIPSYNYNAFLKARLASIFSQSMPIFEIILIDDASTDSSLQTAEKTAQEYHRKIHIIKNKINSGSVFAQWEKAVRQATGDWVWIAEADDLSDPHFLEKIFHTITATPHAAMAFCDSQCIDENNHQLSSSYKHYYNETVGDLLKNDAFFSGYDFLKLCLSERNLILNVSSVIFRRDRLLDALNALHAELKTFVMAGDWRLYTEILLQPDSHILYLNKALNIHRRHPTSVTHALNKTQHAEEIERMHHIISNKITLSNTLKQKQTAYLAHIKKQFGLIK